jgi:subtilisin family serine protease
MAPDARIVSLKVGVADGGADVSQVIAAIDWVVQHKNDNDLNIRVINLSYGTNSAQLYTVDPLAYAAEQAWKAGIFVVAATATPATWRTGSLTNPACDPVIMAVRPRTRWGPSQADDDVASFSSTGSPALRGHHRPGTTPGVCGSQLLHRRDTPTGDRPASSAAVARAGGGDRRQRRRPRHRALPSIDH